MTFSIQTFKMKWVAKTVGEGRWILPLREKERKNGMREIRGRENPKKSCKSRQGLGSCESRQGRRDRRACGGAALFLVAVLTAFVLLAAGCGGRPVPENAGEAAGSGAEETGVASDLGVDGTGKLRVVTTLFPYYDFTRQIAGDQIELTLMVPAGMDSHSFEPTPADMKKIQEADLVICNGGTMEHWFSEVLEALDTSDFTVVTMMDSVKVLEEELVEGMEDAHEDRGEVHAHEEGDYSPGGAADRHDTGTGAEVSSSHGAENAHEEEESPAPEIEYDEHIWTSPVNAMAIVARICDALCEADPAHGELYRQRAEAYRGELARIDAGFRQVSENRKRDRIVVGDKFPFRYLAEEYGLQYSAAFSGCSTDTEPSARTIAWLIDRVREEQIPAVYYLELSSSRVAEIIGEETGAEPLLLHSCHNVTRSQFDRGITYLELMEQNIENLRKGLDS